MLEGQYSCLQGPAQMGDFAVKLSAHLCEDGNNGSSYVPVVLLSIDLTDCIASGRNNGKIEQRLMHECICLMR